MKVSGLDVHKDSIFCAIYNGKEYSEVNEYEGEALGYDSPTHRVGKWMCRKKSPSPLTNALFLCIFAAILKIDLR